MHDLLDVHVMPEGIFLDSLLEDLEGTLHVIAHAGHYENIPFIRQRQEQMKKTYGPWMDHLESDVAVFHVIPAYQEFMDLLKECRKGRRYDFEAIQQRAIEALEQLVPPNDEEQWAAFEEWEREALEVDENKCYH